MPVAKKPPSSNSSMLYQQPTIKTWQQSRKEAKARKNQRGTKVQTQLGTDIVQQLITLTKVGVEKKWPIFRVYTNSSDCIQGP